MGLFSPGSWWTRPDSNRQLSVSTRSGLPLPPQALEPGLYKKNSRNFREFFLVDTDLFTEDNLDRSYIKSNFCLFIKFCEPLHCLHQPQPRHRLLKLELHLKPQQYTVFPFPDLQLQRVIEAPPDQ